MGRGQITQITQVEQRLLSLLKSRRRKIVPSPANAPFRPPESAKALASVKDPSRALVSVKDPSIALESIGECNLRTRVSNVLYVADQPPGKKPIYVRIHQQQHR